MKDRAWQLEPADAARLRELSAAIPDGTDESDPAFVALLDAWETVAPSWSAHADPPVHCYRTKGGRWLVAPAVAVVVAAIGEHAGVPGASAIDAYREYVATPTTTRRAPPGNMRRGASR